MQVYLFRGPGRIFGATADDTGANLPARFAPWAAFKTIELSPGGAPVPGISTAECLGDIDAHGFHITDAHRRITEEAL